MRFPHRAWSGRRSAGFIRVCGWATRRPTRLGCRGSKPEHHLPVAGHSHGRGPVRHRQTRQPISGGHLQRIRDVNRTQHPREQCLDRRLAGTRWRAPHCDRITCTSFSRPPARGPTHDIILGFREVLMPNPIRVLAFVLLCIQCTLAAPSLAETIPVRIEVNVSKPVGPLRPIWRFFGADEPNYAYMKDGRKLLKELGELRPGNVYFRTHNLLTSGDGTPALKWGSTNAYHVDAQGRPVY